MRRLSLGLFGIVMLGLTVGWTSLHPSHNRTWLPEQRLLPRAEFRGSQVVVRNVRDFRWGPGAHVRASWQDRAYDLDRLESVWYVLTPFSRDRRGPAHAFLSFGFADGRHVAVSVEARREQSEQYSLVRGMLKRYELMYIIGDERDLIQLRVQRGDDVYVYPVRATPAQARALFVDMIERANELYEQPEFYGTLHNNCTTNLLAHVNRIAGKKIPYGRRVLLPGHSDELALERGFIDTDLPLEQMRARFLVNERAMRAGARSDYSQFIRAVDE